MNLYFVVSSTDDITLAFVSVTVLELFSGFLCLAGLFYTLFYDSSLIGLVGLIVGSVALLVLLFGQRVSKNYEGAKTITIYFILSIIGVLLA